MSVFSWISIRYIKKKDSPVSSCPPYFSLQVTEGASTKATTMATTTALAAGSAAEGSRGTRGDLTRAAAAAAAAIRAAAGPSSRGTSRADLEDGRRPSQQVSIAASSRD